MAYDVSPYLLLPCRDLPTACRQTRHAKGILVAPCGACALSDMCKSAEARAASILPPPVAANPSGATTCTSGRKAAA
jgi:hypothetical protein